MTIRVTRALVSFASVAAIATLLSLIVPSAVTALRPFALPTAVDCADSAVPRTTRVAAKLTLSTRETDYTRAMSEVQVRVPGSWRQAAALLADPETVQHKNLLYCLLGYDVNEQRYFEVESLPTVELVEQNMIVTFRAQVDDLEWIDESVVPVGLFDLERRGPTSWIARMRYPSALLPANWTSVQVEAPPRWIADPKPWPPDSATDTLVTWAPLRVLPTAERGCQPDQCLSTSLAVPGLRQQSLNASSRYPGEVLAAALYWSPLVWLAFWLRRVARQQGQQPASREVASFAQPVAVLALLAALVWATDSYLSDSPAPAWHTSNWIATWAVTVTAIYCCYRWGLDRTATTVFGLASLALLAYISALLQPWLLTPPGPEEGVTSEEVVLATRLQVAQAHLTMFLLYVGALSAARALLRRLGYDFKQVWIWAVALVLAVTLVAERGLLLAARMRETYSLSTEAPPARATYDYLSYFLPDVLRESAVLVASLLALGAAVLLFTAAGTVSGADGRRVTLTLSGTLLFTIEYWDTWLWGWTIPLWVLTLPLTLQIVRSLRSRLDDVVENNDQKTLLDVVRACDLETLRRQARDWQVNLRQGRAADKRLEEGDIDARAYRQAVDYEQHVGSAGPLGLLSRLWRRRATTREVDRQPLLTSKLTPVDVLLLVGPSLSPIHNAKYAAKVAGIWGAPFALALAAYVRVAYPLPSALTLTSAVLPTLTTAAWLFLEFAVLGAVLGATWHHLPGSRGPIRVLPIALLFAPGLMLQFASRYASGGDWSAQPLVEFLLLLAVATLVGLAMDLRSLRELRQPWQRPRRLVTSVYGLEGLPAQAAFVLAQASALVAIVAFVQGGADGPAGGVPSAPGPGARTGQVSAPR